MQDHQDHLESANARTIRGRRCSLVKMQRAGPAGTGAASGEERGRARGVRVVWVCCKLVHVAGGDCWWKSSETRAPATWTVILQQGERNVIRARITITHRQTANSKARCFLFRWWQRSASTDYGVPYLAKYEYREQVLRMGGATYLCSTDLPKPHRLQVEVEHSLANKEPARAWSTDYEYSYFVRC